MKLAVLSDIHANIYALEAIAKELKTQNVDSVIFLGDLVMTGSRPADCFSLLESLNPVVWIKGNTDAWLEEVDEDFKPSDDREKLIMDRTNWCREKLNREQIDFLADRTIFREYTIGGQNVLLYHGSPRSFSESILPDTDPSVLDEIICGTESKIIICGHTHVRFSMIYRDSYMVNFGSVSIPVEDRTRHARYGIIHDFNGILSFQDKEVDYDFDSYRRDLLQSGYPGAGLILEKYGV